MMDIEQARFNMVEQQIRPCDVSEKNLLDALLSIKREMFVLPQYKNIAFSDLEVPLPNGVKMLCPRIDAMLLQALELNKKDRVLEIGSGSGYVTALLARLSEFVYSMEIDEQAKQFATRNLTYAGINNVSVVCGDGHFGLANSSPYNKIFIGGALEKIPMELKQQLLIGGILVGIIGEEAVMHAVKVVRVGDNEYAEIKLFETATDYLTVKKINKFNF